MSQTIIKNPGNTPTKTETAGLKTQNGQDLSVKSSSETGKGASLAKTG